MQRIAIQGFEGSFHQVAAQRFFGASSAIIACATFRELVRIAQDDPACDGALMAIENSIAGSILPNYNLLRQSGLRVIGEVYLEIRQNLLVYPGVQLKDIREVHSHPMALLQCQEFLDRYSWKLVETEDTALSAAHIRQHQSRHIAGVASELAAGLYGLEIAAAGIQTMKHNYTRFLVLSRSKDIAEPAQADKASVYFHVQHEQGSLVEVLQVIAGCGVNLSKLQSFPIPGSDWQYSFHADLEFTNRSQLQEVMAQLSTTTTELNLYGVYCNGRRSAQQALPGPHKDKTVVL